MPLSVVSVPRSIKRLILVVLALAAGSYRALATGTSTNGSRTLHHMCAVVGGKDDTFQVFPV